MSGGCVECEWATWARTPSGRIQKNISGRCNAALPDLAGALPSCVEAPKFYKNGIWPGDGMKCPTFLLKETK